MSQLETSFFQCSCQIRVATNSLLFCAERRDRVVNVELVFNFLDGKIDVFGIGILCCSTQHIGADRR